MSSKSINFYHLLYRINRCGLSGSEIQQVIQVLEKLRNEGMSIPRKIVMIGCFDVFYSNDVTPRKSLQITWPSFI